MPTPAKHGLVVRRRGRRQRSHLQPRATRRAARLASSGQLMAKGAGLLLPRLTGVPLIHRVVADDRLAVMLAKSFKFCQDRLLRHLLAFGMSAHGLSLCADGSREAIDQLVSDSLRPGDRCRSNVGVLMGVKGAYFLWRELLVNVGKSNPIKLELAGQRAAFHQSAKPPLE